MFIDARSLPDNSLLEVDLAVVGGGPAGITLAREFVGNQVDVAIVEAGGLEFDSDVQALYQGENAGIPYPLEGNRLRFFSGSSNHWGGYCRTLDPIDFEARDWVPHSGWPFSIDALMPYYGPASKIVETGAARYTDKDYWQDATSETLPDPVSGRIDLSFLQFSPPTRFGKRYRDELAQADNVRVLLNANVVDIGSVQQGRSVSGLAIRTLNGLAHQVRARTYVLATGGLENARMLLLSRHDVPQGLGNQNDLVGRYFMEHPHLTGFGELVVADLERLPLIYRQRVPVEGRTAKASFIAADSFMRRHRLLNATFTAGEAGRYHIDQATDNALAQRHATMLGAAGPLLAGGKRRADRQSGDHLGTWLGLGCACEQAPNPESRVSLSEQRDALGLPRIRLDWRLTEQDRRSVVEHIRSLAIEFGALGIGRMRVNVDDPANWPEVVAGGSHHMGTTRMHDDPRHGVVDRHGRVHGVDNLFIAGSSVFPTSGAANPTLTIVALALRLADHLRARFR